jgi:serine/threonine protein kinase
MSTLVGHTLGRYNIIQQLGMGGMATVYKAYDTHLDGDVAVKVLRIDSLTFESLDKTIHRFVREAKALAKLTHPNIVKVIDYGEYEGQPYLVMPLLPGGTLKDKLGLPLNWQAAARMLVPIANALEYAHQNHIIHRDVKPSNILINQKGELMLSDFGIAKILAGPDMSSLTTTGAAVGTPEYMAPEQAMAHEVDRRSDIYSLGVVFYEAITGHKPYTSATPLGALIMHARDPLTDPKVYIPDLPERVERVLLKALAMNPADRYQTMAEFASALDGLVVTPPFVMPGDTAPAPEPTSQILQRREAITLPPVRDPSPLTPVPPPVIARKPYMGDKPAEENKSKRRRPGLVWLLVALTMIILGGAALLIKNLAQDKPSRPNPGSTATLNGTISLAGSSQAAPTALLTLPPSPTTPLAGQTVVILTATTENLAAIRQGPDIHHPQVALNEPTAGRITVDILGRSGDWFLVRTPNGALGWMYKDWLDFSGIDIAAIPTLAEVPTMVVIPTATFTPRPTPTCFRLTLVPLGETCGSLNAQLLNSVGCPKGSYASGEHITVEALLDTGCLVVSWSGTDNNASTEISNTVTMPAGAHTVSCTFGKKPCYSLTLASNPTTAGKVNKSPAGNCGASKYYSGTRVTITAAPNTGYQFDHWSGGGIDGSKINSVIITMNNNKSITAYFVLAPHLTPGWMEQVFLGVWNSWLDQTLGLPAWR